MKSKETIHIAYPHGGEVDAYFAHGMMQLIKLYPDRISSFNNVLGLGLLAKSRNIIVKTFLDQSSEDWLLMIDSDEYLAPEAFEKLVEAADKDKYPFICGLYFGLDQTNHTYIKPVPLIFKMTDRGVEPYFDYPRNEIVEIYAAGTGAMLIHRSVLEKMREAYGEVYGEDWCWFQDGPLDGNKWLSEDLNFCQRAQDIDIKIFAHTGVLLPHHKPIWVMESHYMMWKAQEAVLKHNDNS